MLKFWFPKGAVIDRSGNPYTGSWVKDGLTTSQAQWYSATSLSCAFGGDVVTADQDYGENPVALNADLSVRLAYTFVPVIIENTFAADLFDVGFSQVYTDPSNHLGHFDSDPANNANNGSYAGQYRMNAFNESNFGLFMLGYSLASDTNIWNLWNTNATTGRWLTSGTGFLSKTAGGKLMVDPALLQAARNWWTTERFNGILIPNSQIYYYPYKWSSHVDRYVFPSTSSQPVSGQKINLPAGHVLYGFAYFVISDSVNTQNDFLPTGSNFRVNQHGAWSKWELDSAITNLGTVSSPVKIRPTWWNSSVGVREVRAGVYLGAKKIG